MPAPPDLTDTAVPPAGPPSSDPDLLLEELQLFGMRLGLDACRRLLEALGAPQRSVPTVLVAGTNGKGSTAVLLAAMGTAAGYRTGLYTSPHLESVEERLRLDGVAIPRSALASLLQEILAAARVLSKDPITYFEALTVAGYLYFARKAVDLAVFEVGLGGRLDATNTGEPILSVITSIGLDHQEHLGNSLAKIAREKAGILRPGRPAVGWVEEPEALAAIEAVAFGLGTPFHRAPEELRWEDHRSLGWRGQHLSLETSRQSLRIDLALLGEHQLANLALAVRAAELLEAQGFTGLRGPALEQGAATCRWPGRLEVVDLPGGRRVLLDAAHNPSSARRLGGFLETHGEPLDLLFGVLEDKDAAGILNALAPLARKITLTRPSSPRARDPQTLLPLFPPGRQAEVEDRLEDALEGALERALEKGPRTLVACGSIYLIGPVRTLLRKRFGVPDPAAQVRTGPARPLKPPSGGVAS